MGTSLCIITNSKRTGEENWDKKLEQFRALNLARAQSMNYKTGEVAEDGGEWEYYKCDLEPYSIDFDSPTRFSISFYNNVGLISTIFRYNILYRFHELDWFPEFRKELYSVIKVMGGTEAIYLADNACDKLSIYLEVMAEDDVPYEVIKSKMIEELGEPVRDYSLLDGEQLSYQNITAFFLDGFEDMDG